MTGLFGDAATILGGGAVVFYLTLIAVLIWRRGKLASIWPAVFLSALMAAVWVIVSTWLLW